jgi:hypothetical protein
LRETESLLLVEVSEDLRDLRGPAAGGEEGDVLDEANDLTGS